MKAKLDELKIAHRNRLGTRTRRETRERVEAVKRWFVHDWQTLDNKIKSSIVEGVSVFLAMFDMPDVAKVFCPAAPQSLTILKPLSCKPKSSGSKRRRTRRRRRRAQKRNAERRGGESGAKPQAGPIRYTCRRGRKGAEAEPTAKKPEPVKAGGRGW